MKTILTAAAAALFAANIGAAEIYHGLGEGNPDLSNVSTNAGDFVGVQPSVGDSVYRYHGWETGNTDLFKGDGTQTPASTGKPEIYDALSANPDLQF
jgi:hypothetical protein